jgi:hypothetical protein
MERKSSDGQVDKYNKSCLYQGKVGMLGTTRPREGGNGWWMERGHRSNVTWSLCPWTLPPVPWAPTWLASSKAGLSQQAVSIVIKQRHSEKLM